MGSMWSGGKSHFRSGIGSRTLGRLRDAELELELQVQIQCSTSISERNPISRTANYRTNRIFTFRIFTFRISHFAFSYYRWRWFVPFRTRTHWTGPLFVFVTPSQNLSSILHLRIPLLNSTIKLLQDPLLRIGALLGGRIPNRAKDDIFPAGQDFWWDRAKRRGGGERGESVRLRTDHYAACFARDYDALFVIGNEEVRI